MAADVLVFALWTALYVGLTLRHVPWRDEFQSWLVSTTTTTLASFFDGVRYERHPPLFYIFQRMFHALPYASELDPLLSIRLISGFFSVLVTGLWIFCFDTPWWFRYSVPFSLPMLREYSVISSRYPAGIAFLLLGALAQRSGRVVLYWVALLFAGAVHALFTVMAGALFVMSLWDARHELRQRRLTHGAWALVVALGFLALVIFQLPPAHSQIPARPRVGDLVTHGLTIIAFGVTAIEAGGDPYGWNDNPWTNLSAIPFLLAMFGLAVYCRFPWVWLAIVLAPVVGILGGIYNNGLRGAGFILVGLIIVALVDGKPLTGRKSCFLLVPICVTLVATGIWIAKWKPWADPPAFDFSGSGELVKAMGPELRRPDSVLFVDNDGFFAVMGQLNIPVFDVSRDRMVYYPYFNVRYVLNALERWCAANRERIEDRYPDRTLWIGLWSGETPPATCGCAVRVFQTQRPVVEEPFALFRWRPRAQHCEGSRPRPS